MKTVAIVALLISAMGSQVPHPLSTSESTTAYVLHDEKRHKWCAYRDEGRWRDAIETSRSQETVSVSFKGQYPRVVKITRADNPEAGDWIINETYYLNEDGTVSSLERVTNVLPGDVSRKEVFVRINGKLLRKSVAMRSLASGGAVVDPKQLWFPHVAVAENRTDFGFSGLLQRLKEVRDQGTVCIPAPVGSNSNVK